MQALDNATPQKMVLKLPQPRVPLAEQLKKDAPGVPQQAAVHAKQLRRLKLRRVAVALRVVVPLLPLPLLEPHEVAGAPLGAGFADAGHTPPQEAEGLAGEQLQERVVRLLAAVVALAVVTPLGLPPLARHPVPEVFADALLLVRRVALPLVPAALLLPERAAPVPLRVTYKLS